MNNNQTFTRGGPTWGNACVGNNGEASYFYYAKGYSVAANILIEEVIKKNNEDVKISVDEIVYPICFNMRHSVELRLKGLIVELIKVSEYRRKLPDFKLEETHDLGRMWSYISSHAPEFDERYSSFIKELDSYINDISTVDTTGQVFRYPMSNDNQRHLVDLDNISIHMLHKKFKELEVILDKLNEFNYLIQEEYSYQSYTNNLSRVDICKLAEHLPPRDTWKSDGFRMMKGKLQDYFSISSNELSKAIKIIENNYEFSQKISLPKKLKHTKIDDLIDLFDVWFKLHKQDKQVADKSYLTSPTYFFEKMKGKEEILEAEWEDSLKNISLKSLAEIRSLFYFEEELDYSENYMLMVEEETKVLEEILSTGQDLYKPTMLKLLNKTSTFKKIMISLFFLGQQQIAEKLIMKYIPDEEHNWLNEARRGALSQKKQLLGY